LHLDAYEIWLYKNSIEDSTGLSIQEAKKRALQEGVTIADLPMECGTRKPTFQSAHAQFSG
jgi:hypothetical protein